MKSLDFCLVSFPCPFSNCTCKNCPYSVDYILERYNAQLVARNSHLIISSDILFFDLK